MASLYSILFALYQLQYEYVVPPLRVINSLSFIGGVHIGARALLDPKLIWFGHITRLSQWGGGG